LKEGKIQQLRGYYANRTIYSVGFSLVLLHNVCLVCEGLKWLDFSDDYRELVNKIIEVIEKITYKEKEHVLDQVWNDFKVWSELELASAPTKLRGGKHERNRN